MKLTLKFKLEQNQSILNTMDAYVSALNYVSLKEFSINTNPTNPTKLSKNYYYTVRENFKLPAQQTCSVFRDIAAAYKKFKTRKKKIKKAVNFKSKFFTVIRNRDYSFCPEKQIVKITTVDGRKTFNIKVSDYHKQYLDHATSYCDSTVSKDKKDRIYLNLTVEIPDTKELETGNTMGIDVGLSKLATCCTNEGKTLVIKGGIIKDKRNNFLNLRKRLQHKGTISAKRLLKKLSGKENRWMRDVNYCAVISILQFAKDNNVSHIGIEDLTNIRESSKKFRKELKREINSWAFYQFKTILSYKAKMQGVKIILVDPHYTSQTCSHCGYTDKHNRKSQKHFLCKSCGFSANADINAASNIELLTRIIRSNELSRGDINHPDAKDVDSEGLIRQLKTSLNCKLIGLSDE